MSTKPIALKESTNIKGASYDEEAQTLDVTFASGEVWRYKNVPPAMSVDFGEAPSAGKWFAEHIKRKPHMHPGEKISTITAKDPSPAAAPASATSTAAPEPVKAVTPAEPPKPNDAPLLVVDESKVSTEVLADAEELYLAYIANSDGKAWDGRPCPAWKDLGSPVRSHWCAVATRARRKAAPLHAELDRMKGELDKVTHSAAALDQRRVDAAVKERTKTLESEVDKLRASHATLEAEHAKLKGEKSTFAPWKKRGEG